MKQWLWKDGIQPTILGQLFFKHVPKCVFKINCRSTSFGKCIKTFSSFAKTKIGNTLFMVFIEVKVVKTLTEERLPTTLEVDIAVERPSLIR
jgi:hypothetical protein